METLEKKALKNDASTEIFEDNLSDFNKALTNERFKEKNNKKDKFVNKDVTEILKTFFLIFFFVVVAVEYFSTKAVSSDKWTGPAHSAKTFRKFSIITSNRSL